MAADKACRRRPMSVLAGSALVARQGIHGECQRDLTLHLRDGIGLGQGARRRKGDQKPAKVDGRESR